MQIEYDVYLRDTITGDLKTYRFKSRQSWGDTIQEHDNGIIWFWSEGNYGCDCNRSIMLWCRPLSCDNCDKCGNKEGDFPCTSFEKGQRIYVDKIINIETGKELDCSKRGCEWNQKPNPTKITMK